jgi:hypothetical protein
MAKGVKPKRLEDVPEYAAEVQKLGVIRENLRQANERACELSERIETARNLLTQQARRLLETGSFEAAKSDQSIAEFQSVRDRAAVLAEAERLQLQFLEQVRGRAAAIVRDSCADEYREIGGRIRAALRSLMAALDEEVAFRDRLDSDGIGFGSPLEPLAFRRVGSRAEDGGYVFIENWIRETADFLGR